MFIYQLDVTISFQQHGIIIKPGNHPLQFDPIDQKYGNRDVLFSDLVQKNILKILCFFHVTAFGQLKQAVNQPATGCYSPVCI